MSYKSSLIEAIEASHAVLHMLGSVFKSLCVFECCVYRSVFLRSLRIRPTMSLSYTYWFLDTVLEKFFMGSRFCYCKILQLMVKIILNLQWCKIYFNVTILHFECVGDGHKKILLVYLVCKMHVWFFGGFFCLRLDAWASVVRSTNAPLLWATLNTIYTGTFWYQTNIAFLKLNRSTIFVQNRVH